MKDYASIVIGLADRLGIEPERLWYNEPTDEEAAEGLSFPDEITGSEEHAIFAASINEKHPTLVMFDVVFEPADVLYRSDRSLYNQQLNLFVVEQHGNGTWTLVRWPDRFKPSASYHTVELDEWIARARLALERRHIRETA